MNNAREGRATALDLTGIAGLDDILCGGLAPYRLYLVEGDPGAGKTTLGLQFLLEGVRKGDSGVYVALSETRDELLSIARSHGWSLDGITIIELAPNESSLGGDEENTMFHVSDVELTETTRLVLRQVEKLRSKRLVFDSLSELRLLAQNPLRYRRQILALKQYFIGRGCTVLLLDDHSSSTPDLQVQSIAHGVIGLEQRSPDYGVMQRRLQIVKMRGKAFRAGFHDYVIAEGGLRVFPRLVAADHALAEPGGVMSSGLPELDALTGGGVERGTSTLLIGPAGSGKSSLTAQYAVAAAARAERSALFMFDESPKTFVQRTTGLGMDVERHLRSGMITLHQIDPGAISTGEFVHRVRQEADGDARIIVIDSLNGFLNATPDARFLTLQLHELLSYLGQRGVATFLVVAQHGLLGNAMQTPIDATYLADTVILLRFFEAMGRVRQALSVVKKRSGAHERSIREYHFDGDGIHVGPPLEQFHGVLAGVPTYLGGTAAQRERA
jgi:circadian clock protein KaiC